MADTALTVDNLKAYVHASDTDDTYVATCFAEAEQLIATYVGAVDVPADVKSRATLEVGSELYHRRQAPNGIAQFATPDAAPIRVARDPMLSAYPLLARYLSGGFA